MINEKKDACYQKVKSRYSVWPSAYASGALVKCRKKGAKNWGKGRKDEALHTAYFNFGLQLIDEGRRRTRAQKNRTAARRASDQEFQDSDKTLMRGVKSEPALLSKASDGIKRVAGGIQRANKLRKLQKQRGLQAAKAKREAELAAKKAPIPEPSSKEAARAAALAARNKITTNPNDAGDRREDAGRRKELRQRLKDKEASEQEARAASRGTTRSKINYSIGIDPKTGERGIISKRQNIVSSYPTRLLRAKRQQATDSPLKAARAVKRAVIGSPISAFRRGRAAMKARRPRMDFSLDHTEYQKIGAILAEASAAWTRKAGKNPSGGLNAKGVASYRAKNPGSKLKTAVTTKPSKLKKGSKAAKRRSSFCSRMSGMRKRQNPKNNTGKDRLSLSLKKWNC